jgi:hypothetical protein
MAMTAQVALLNKLAVALASDSSLTITRFSETRRSFPSADKITPLPEPHQIAVMHSGNTERLGVPYGLLLGEWSRSLPAGVLPRVGEYAGAFVSWLADQKALFDEQAESEYLDWMLRDYFLAVRADILERCQSERIEPDEWKSRDALALTTAVIEQRLKALELLDSYDELDFGSCRAFLDQHHDQFVAVVDWVFDDTPRFEETDRLLADLAAQLLVRREPFSRDATLVFAGFGGKEFFPATEDVVVSGLLAGHLRAYVSGSTVISSQNSSSIIPYAQAEAVNTFLRGYNRSFLNKAHEVLDGVLSTPECPPDESTAAESEQRRRQAHEELETAFDDLSWERFIEPLVGTVAGLPGTELGRIAESLVGLQALRQLTQAEAETVGGPVDVMLITRAHGITWVKHKSLGLTNPLEA